MPVLPQVLPAYLQPPSPTEKAQLDMQETKMHHDFAAQGAAMAARSLELMQRRATMARIQGRATELAGTPGFDQESGMDQALIENAPTVFSDPEAYAKAVPQLMDRIEKRKALLKVQARNIELMGQDNPETGQKFTGPEALAKSFAENFGSMGTTGTGLATYLGTQTRADTAAKSLTEKRNEFRAREDRLKTMETDRKDLGQQRVDLGYYKADTTSDTAEANRASREKIATKSETGKERRAKAALLLKAEADPQIKAIDASISDATTTLAEKQQSPKWHWLTDEAGVKKSIEDLKAQRAKRLKELGVEDSTSEAAPDASEPMNIGRYKVTK